MIVTPDNLQAVYDRLMPCEALSVDTETTSLRPFHGGYAFSYILSDGVQAFYFPYEIRFHTDGQKLRDLFAKPRLWLMMNASFDMHMLALDGIFLHGKIHDIKVGARLLKNDEFKYSLELIAQRAGMVKSNAVEEWITENGAWEWQDIPGKKTRVKNKHFDQVPLDVIVPYACQDALITFRLGAEQLQQVKDADLVRPPHHPPLAQVLEMESSLTRAVFHVEQLGVRIDRAYCMGAITHETQRLEAAADAWLGATGVHFQDSPAVFAKGLPESAVLTATGRVSYNAEALDGLAAGGNELARTVLTWRDAKKRLDFYHGFLYHADSHDNLHANFDQAGTVTGRFCVAKGTYIDAVRDLSKHPEGILIEDLKAGDFLYAYDEELNLRIRRIKWVGPTGEKKICRVNWLGQGRKHSGYLDLTPEHRVRMSTGEYVRARDLQKNDSLLALGRSKTLGYSRLHTRDRELREHRLIYQEITGNSAEHVHHLDGNKLNNLLGNLEGLTAAEHTSMHSREFAKDPERRRGRAECMRLNWATGRIKARFGAECGNFISLSRFSLLREIARCKGSPTKSLRVKDFNTFKKKLAAADIDYRAVARRYSRKGYLSRGLVKKSLWLPTPKNHEFLGVGLYAYKNLCAYYGFKIWNHIVTSVEDLPGKTLVYDIEMEEFSNFIANEICVHNSSSSPNLQQLTKTDEAELWPVRRAIVPRPGFSFYMLDFQQSEYRLMLDYAGRFVAKSPLVDAVLGGADVHQATADAAGIHRWQAKNVNFAILYCAGLDRLATMIGVHRSEAAHIRSAVMDAAPEIRLFIDAATRKAAERGYVVNWFGRKWHLSDSRFAYRAPNFLCQGGGADAMKIAWVQAFHMLLDRKAESRIVLQVHDELVLEIRHGEEALVDEVKAIMDNVYPFKLVPQRASVAWSKRSLADKEK